MKLILLALTILLALITFAQCQQTAEDWFNKGVALGTCDEAIEAYDEAIRLDPGYAWAWYNRGLLLADQRRDGEAIQSLKNAVRLDPTFSGPVDYEISECIGGPDDNLVKLQESDAILKQDPDDWGALKRRWEALRALDRNCEADAAKIKLLMLTHPGQSVAYLLKASSWW